MKDVGKVGFLRFHLLNALFTFIKSLQSHLSHLQKEETGPTPRQPGEPNMSETMMREVGQPPTSTTGSSIPPSNSPAPGSQMPQHSVPIPSGESTRSEPWFREMQQRWREKTLKSTTAQEEHTPPSSPRISPTDRREARSRSWYPTHRKSRVPSWAPAPMQSRVPSWAPAPRQSRVPSWAPASRQSMVPSWAPTPRQSRARSSPPSPRQMPAATWPSTDRQRTASNTLSTYWQPIPSRPSLRRAAIPQPPINPRIAELRRSAISERTSPDARASQMGQFPSPLFPESNRDVRGYSDDMHGQLGQHRLGRQRGGRGRLHAYDWIHPDLRPTQGSRRSRTREWEQVAPNRWNKEEEKEDNGNDGDWEDDNN